MQAIVQKKYSVYGLNLNTTTYDRIKWYKYFGPFGIEALDATNGQFIWRSERFAKGVTDAFIHDGQVVVASGRELYNLNPETGIEK